MKLRYTTIIAAFALLAASCSHEESADAQRADLQLTISASFADSSALFAVDSPDSNTDHAADYTVPAAPLAAPSATRATATAFESGDSLGLYAVRSGGELNAASNLINNHKFKVSSTGAIVGDMLPAFYPDQTTSLDLFSYYPYQSGNATADALGVLVGIRTHQTDFSSLMASDCCYGSKLSAAPSTAAHPLRFKHIFAQLRLNFSLYENCPAIASVKILKVRDQAKLNLQTGVVTLSPSSTVVDIEPFVSSADAANPLQFTAILPAQPLSAACLEITLADGTIYYYNATSPIALTASATNTLNLRIADKKLVTLDDAPIISAWGAISASGLLGESVNNLISLYWLAPHASFAAVDKITVSIVDILNRRREVEVTPTLDPLSSAEYATYTFPLILGADAGYPQIIENIKLYAGATLLRDAPTDGIVGLTLTKAGAHTLGLSVWIKISETVWNNVSGYGDSKTITVTPTGTTEWTATSTNPALTVTKSGNTATLKWASHFSASILGNRTATVTFETVPNGASAKLTTTQNQGPDYIIINGLKWKTYNVGATTPQGYGTYHDFVTAPAACASLGGGWRLPTSDEFGTVSQYSPWTQFGGINGRWFGPTSGWSSANAIFFPAAGYRSYSSMDKVGTDSFYWSSTENDSSNAYYLNFYSTSVNPQITSYKTNEFSVRCVQDAPTEPQPPTADQIVEINGLKWTTGNLVAVGNHNAKVGAPTDHGLYFQFGSLLGWKGGATGDGAGVCTVTAGKWFGDAASFNATDEIAVTPSVFTTIANIGTTWPDQTQNLYYFGLSSYATAYARLRDFIGFSAGTLAASGVGDPCTYYLGSPWRMPTAEEWQALCNNYAGGDNLGSANAAWTTSPTAGMNFNNNGTKYFIPASGYRLDINGSFYDVGRGGYGWSESVTNADGGYTLAVNSGGVYPHGAGSRRSSVPVRCVSN